MRRFAAALLTGLLAVGAAPAFAADVPLPATVLSSTVSDEAVTFEVLVPDVPSELDAKAFTSKVTVGAEELPSTMTITDLAAAPVHKVLLAIDASGSMSGTGILAAQRAAKAFVAAAPADLQIGLVTFAQKAQLVVKPTTSRASILTGIASLKARGDTALYDAIILAAKSAGTAGDRSILVLSDGADTDSKADLAQTAAQLQQLGVRANFVAFRTSKAQVSTLNDLARAGSGQVLAAKDAASLTSIYAAAATARPATLRIVAKIPAILRGLTSTFALSIAAGNFTSPLTADVNVPASTPPTSTSSSASASSEPQPTTAPASSPATPATQVSTGLQFTLDPVLIGIGLGVLAALLLLIYLLFDTSDREHRRRMQQVLADSVNPQGLRGGTPLDGEPKATNKEGVIGTFVKRMLHRDKRNDQLAAALDGAQIKMSPSDWIMLRSLFAIAFGLLFGSIAAPWILTALVGAVVGWLAPQQYLVFQRNRRRREFEHGLPDVLMMIAGSLRAGFSLEQAVASSADQGGSEVAAQLRRAIQEVRLGGTLEESLERVAIRTDSEDVRWVVTALRIQRKSGGNLAELLSTAAATVRERGVLAREVRSLTAEGRMSAYILIALPIGLFAFLYATRRDYLEPLWTTSTGMLLGLGGIGLLIVGWAWMQKMIKVEV